MKPVPGVNTVGCQCRLSVNVKGLNVEFFMLCSKRIFKMCHQLLELPLPVGIWLPPGSGSTWAEFCACGSFTALLVSSYLWNPVCCTSLCGSWALELGSRDLSLLWHCTNNLLAQGIFKEKEREAVVTPVPYLSIDTRGSEHCGNCYTPFLKWTKWTETVKCQSTIQLIKPNRHQETGADWALKCFPLA